MLRLVSDPTCKYSAQRVSSRIGVHKLRYKGADMEKVRLVAVVELQSELVDVEGEPGLDKSADSCDAWAVKLGPMSIQCRCVLASV